MEGWLVGAKNDFARVENAKFVWINAISFELVLNKKQKFFVVSCYLLPTIGQGGEGPAGSMPLVISDLTAILNAPQS